MVMDKYWAHYGAHNWRRFISLWFSCPGQDLALLLELLYFVLGSVVPLFLLWICLVYYIPLDPKLCTFWIFMYATFLFIWGYPIIWDATVPLWKYFLILSSCFLGLFYIFILFFLLSSLLSIFFMKLVNVDLSQNSSDPYYLIHHN